jgi:uncharacterized damage-inducible protein DinB
VPSEGTMQFDLEEAIGMLGRTPAVLTALLSDIPDAWLHNREGEGTFSAHDVLGHLIFGEQTDWIPRTRIILESGEARPFEPFDRRGHESVIAGRPVDELLQQFSTLRVANLETLRGFRLDERAIGATGMHPALGRVTLRELLATWVAHDLSHIGQMVRVMGKRYREDVGPWREYLRIMG